MKVYIVTIFDNDERDLSLNVYKTKELAEREQKIIADCLCEELKAKHDDVKVDWNYGMASIWNGEFYEYEIDVYEEEVQE